MNNGPQRRLPKVRHRYAFHYRRLSRHLGRRRRLYIPRGATQAEPATDGKPEVAALPERISVYDMDTLKPVGEISGIGGNGVVIDPKSGHGFSSDHPNP